MISTTSAFSMTDLITFMEEIRAEAFKPVLVDGGTPYPTNQADIDIHRAFKFTHHNKGPFVSSREATRQLMFHNIPHRRVQPIEQDALNHLLDLFRDARDGCRWGPDLAIKCFRDLDIVFFRGKLQGNVCVKWDSPTEGNLHLSNSRKLIYGYQQAPWRGGQGLIVLNADAILNHNITRTPFQEMFLTLLHEMCHAYDSVVCPHLSAYWRDAHDSHFGTRISAVHQRAMRILGLRVISTWEPYVPHHVFEDEIGPRSACSHTADKVDADAHSRDSRTHESSRKRWRGQQDQKSDREEGRQCVLM